MLRIAVVRPTLPTMRCYGSARGRDSIASLFKSQVIKKRTLFSSYAIALPQAGRG
jgi:hypothetical protein